MATKVAVNGFGRIGRLVFRHLMDEESFDVVAVNDIAPLDNLVYLLEHDSVHASPDVPVEVRDGGIGWGGSTVEFHSESDPADLPWERLGVELVIEASGVFREREKASLHIEAGAERVLITAPAKDPDVTVCMGVNEDDYDPDSDVIVSNASCTTNCLAPVALVLDEEFGIESGFLTTVHAYTSSQSIVDAPSKKWRRGRAAAASIVPTTTGAAVATTEVLPRLAGKLDGMAMRVPVPNGSIIDFVAHTERTASVESVNDAFRRASGSERLRRVLGVTDEELVSQDIIGTTWSALVDLPSTMALGDRAVKVLAWYDNEWAYSRRVVDLALHMTQPVPARA